MSKPLSSEKRQRLKRNVSRHLSGVGRGRAISRDSSPAIIQLDELAMAHASATRSGYCHCRFSPQPPVHRPATPFHLFRPPPEDNGFPPRCLPGGRALNRRRRRRRPAWGFPPHSHATSGRSGASPPSPSADDAPWPPGRSSCAPGPFASHAGRRRRGWGFAALPARPPRTPGPGRIYEQAVVK